MERRMKRKAPIAVLDGLSSSCGDDKEEKTRLIGKRSSKKATTRTTTNTRSSSHQKKTRRLYGSRKSVGATTSTDPRSSSTTTTATLQKPSHPSLPPQKPRVQENSISESLTFGPAPRQGLHLLSQPSLPLPPPPAGDDANTTGTTRQHPPHSTTDTTEMTSNVKARLPEKTTQHGASVASSTIVTEAARLLETASTSNNNKNINTKNPLKRKHSGNLPAQISSSKDNASSDSNSVKFRVDESRPFLGLAEGVQATASPTLQTDYLPSVVAGRQSIPRVARMMELPSTAMLGMWTARLVDAQDGSGANFSNSNLTGSRLSLRHESYTGIGGLQPSTTTSSSQSSSAGAPPLPQDTSSNLTVSCIHPSHNRIASMQCQGVVDKSTHSHPHSFLGSLSFLAFEGFTSTSDMNTRAQDVSKVLVRATVPITDSSSNSKLHKQSSSLLLKIPNFGVSLLCSLPLDSNHVLWIGQDPNVADNSIVAVDVIFSSDPTSDTSSLLASEDPFQLTEERLHSHTSSVVETRYDPFQRLWGKHANKESLHPSSNIDNHYKPAPAPQDECDFTKPDNILLPPAKRSALSSKAKTLASKFPMRTRAIAIESNKMKAPGNLPQQQQQQQQQLQLQPSPKKKSRRTLALGTMSHKKSVAFGTSCNNNQSALAPFPSVTPTPRPTTATTTTKSLPHHHIMEPTNFLERFDKAQNTVPKKLPPILTDPPVVQRMGGSPFQNLPPSRMVDDGDDIPFDDDDDTDWHDLRPKSTPTKEQKILVKPRRPLTNASKRQTIVRESWGTSDTWEIEALHARLELKFPSPFQSHDTEKENKTPSLKNKAVIITRPHGVSKPNWRSVVYLLATLIPMDGQGPPPSIVPTRTVSGIGASKFQQQHNDPIVVLKEEWGASLISHLQRQPQPQPQQPEMETVETSTDSIAEEDVSWSPLGWLGGNLLVLPGWF